MTQERWNRLTTFEQMSNIDGEVQRMVAFITGGEMRKQEDIDRYFCRISDLVFRTISDPKNRERSPEILGELHEIERYLHGETDADYILRYWNVYTTALAG